ncbi:hypothetical protein Pan54_40730 [Rubinisphaera italica]|uniref:Uncharacterized protein n=2 Tax=Rubinisphaera italica TaxID=2527969 RepID=A0A5C5XK60_9PLAN|nr:hypothetical protein Pan54_40730 [Rubinisphaera italica]
MVQDVFTDCMDSTAMEWKSILILLLGAFTFLQGCAAPPGGAAALPAPPGLPPLPPGADGSKTVVVPNNLNVNVHRSCCSLFDFLGFPRIGTAFRNLAGGVYQLTARLFPVIATGFPEREPGDPVLPLDSPANLTSSSPAVQSAAKIKMDENQAQQKVKAINYLATIGCGGCYPDVEDAFLAALDDCTESVRYAAVVALKESGGNACAYCSHKSCCSPKIRNKLMEMTQEGDCLDCPGEPSPRVRRVARLALFACGAKGLAAVPDILPGDIEGPTLELAPPPAVGESIPAQTPETGVQQASYELATTPSNPVEGLTGLDQSQVEELASSWLAELPADLSLDEKRDILRKRMRNYLQTQNEREILVGDIVHELQVQQQILVKESVQTNPMPKQKSPVQVAPPRELKFPQPSMAGKPIVQQIPQPIIVDSQIQQVSHQSQAVMVRWESLILMDDAVPNGRKQLEQLRAFLKNSPQANPPEEFFRQQLTAKTIDWTNTGYITNSARRGALESIAIGEMSDVIEIEGGYEIVRVLQRKPIGFEE